MMNIIEQIEKMKQIQNSILEFVDKEDDTEEYFQNIITQIEDINLSKKKKGMKTLLYLLSKISNNHYRYPNFITKIERIIQRYKQEITNFFSNFEIYKIFRKNCLILLFLYKEEIMKMDDDISRIIPKRIFIYLFPEKSYEMKFIDKIPENYEDKQIIGENDDMISEIIRKDLIEDFITFVNKNNYSLKSKIKRSFFETNDFLIKHGETTLIDYAAFFGSTQIFKYLYTNGAEITSRLWLYGIHSDNPEIIHHLLEKKVGPPNGSYEECIKEAIKCHHNDITNYIQSNLINEDIKSIIAINFEENYKTNIYSYSFHYYNFSYFPSEIQYKIIFYYACQYDYLEIVEYFLNSFRIDITERIIIIYKFLSNYKI